uniref:Putative mariner-4 hm n=1 Tax=Culex tarsalis TaxID=7177 RepID=A0A1Q3FAY7_CULTA
MFAGSDCSQNLETDNDDSTEISVDPGDDSSNGEGQTKKRKHTRDQYTQEQLQLAIEAVKNGSTVYNACKLYGVPRPTLQYRLKKNITDLEVKLGAKCYLNKSQELSMVGPLQALADAGFTITHKLIKTFVMEYVKANIDQFPSGSPFPAEIPGKSWLVNFHKRHPDLAKRMTENWAHYGSASVTLERVPVWFGCVTRYLEKLDLKTVIQNREQVFTLDDVQLSRGKHDATFTCLFGANACGNLIPPLILYPDEIKIPTEKRQLELKYAVAQQDNELTAGNALFQWLSKVFQPWLIGENIPRPVILFIDGHRHQMGYRSSHFCQQHQIVPVSLLPRNNNMLRPLNVKLFETIRKLWPDEMKSPDNHIFTSMDPLLKPILDKLTDTKNIIRDGFYQSKLYPWNPDGHSAKCAKPQPDVVPKVRKNAAKPAPRPTVDPTMLVLFRKMLESRLSEQLLGEFHAQRHNAEWQGSVEQTCVFQMWRNLMNEIDAAEPEQEADHNWACLNGDTVQEEDEFCFHPEMVTVKQEDTGECSTL